MNIQIKASNFRQIVQKKAVNKNHNVVCEYLRMTGNIIESRNGIMTVDEKWEEKLDQFVAPIESGDIIWSSTYGLLLVIDTRPEVNADGHHFRSLKVDIDENGGFKIQGELRSIVADDSETFRIRKSNFDIKKIDYYTYERYLAYKRIGEIDDILTNMKED